MFIALLVYVIYVYLGYHLCMMNENDYVIYILPTLWL